MYLREEGEERDRDRGSAHRLRVPRSTYELLATFIFPR